MKPIKLSLTKQHIDSLAYTFRFFKSLPENNRNVRCLQSILLEVKLKVEKKKLYYEMKQISSIKIKDTHLH